MSPQARRLRVAEPLTRSAIYTRVSHDASGRQRSPQEQEQGARRDADMHDLDVVTVYSDVIGASRRTNGRSVRPDFERMKRDMARSAFDVLVVYGIDRVSRRTREWEDMIDLCEAHEIRLMINGRAFDLTDPRDRAQVKQEAIYAELEVEVLRMRVMRALATNVEAGLPHGKNLWGYRRITDRTGHMIGVEPDPQTARLVREAFDRYDSGESLVSITRDFERRGIAAPGGACPSDCDKTTTKTGRVHRHRTGSWNEGRSKLRQTLANPSYLGHRSRHGEIVKRNAWPALVDEAQFQRVQHRLRVASKNRTNAGAAPISHLLSGLMRCGVCDGPTSFTNVGTPTHRGGVYGVYKCRRGGHVARKAEPVEDAIVALVIMRAADPKLLAEWQRDNGKRLTAVTRELLELSTHLAESKAEWKDGKLRAATYAEIESDYAPRIDALQAEQDQLNAGVPAEILRIAGDSVDAVTRKWHAASLIEQRAAIRAMLEITMVRKTPGHLGISVRMRSARKVTTAELL